MEKSWQTWEWVVFIAMFVFGIGMPLWAYYMMGPPVKPEPQSNAEAVAVAKAFEEAKDKQSATVFAEPKTPGEVPAESVVVQTEATASVK